MNVSLTGSTGTVGTAVLERLSAGGARVRVLVRDRQSARPGTDTIVGSLSDKVAVDALVDGAQVVVHCAAVLNNDPLECRRTNLEGTRSVAEATLAAGARLVHLSTVSVYDHQRSLSLDEASVMVEGAPDDYACSKAEAERVVTRLGDRGLAFVILRPVVILSMHARAFWGPLAVERAKQAPGPIVPLAAVPWVHVDNLTEAIALAATRDAAVGSTYNVIDGDGPADEYVRAVSSAAGLAPIPVPAGAPVVRYAGQRIRDELGYAPRDRWTEFLAQLAVSQGSSSV
jgi:nucleoside-diphosphate-sugar epimerase